MKEIFKPWLFGWLLVGGWTVLLLSLDWKLAHPYIMLQMPWHLYPFCTELRKNNRGSVEFSSSCQQYTCYERFSILHVMSLAERTNLSYIGIHAIPQTTVWMLLAVACSAGV